MYVRDHGCWLRIGEAQEVLIEKKKENLVLCGNIFISSRENLSRSKLQRKETNGKKATVSVKSYRMGDTFTVEGKLFASMKKILKKS